VKDHTRFERTRNLLKIYSNGLGSHPLLHHTRETARASHRVPASRSTLVTTFLRWVVTFIRGLLTRGHRPKRSPFDPRRAPSSD
jgi:hypothetical protein